MAQKNLHIAKQQKLDEFYTQIGDIERECSRYREQFKGKVIFLNCDDPVESNFWRHFALNFTRYGLKKLVATHFEREKPSYKLELTGDMNEDGTVNDDDIVKTPLKQNGDFRSDECIEILKEADIVVTNPPFSLFREYVTQLMEYDKKFLILGNQNAVTYKDVFSFIRDNRLWLGYDNGGTKWFQVPMDYDIKTESRKKIENGIKYFSMGSVIWFTNLDTTKRHEEVVLYKKYNFDEYPKYDEYDAININKVADIPTDYDGVMGVPVTFLDKYNPDQFEVIGIDRYVEDNPNYGKRFTINGKEIYARILIKRRQQS